VAIFGCGAICYSLKSGAVVFGVGGIYCWWYLLEIIN